MAKLRDVRLELQARLGYGTSDVATITPILNSFLADAQRQLYEVGTYKALTKYWDITVPPGSANVAYPSTSGNEMNPDKVTRVMVDIGSSGTPYFVPVQEGIRPCDYNDNSASYPRRYERRGDGFEFSPARDKAYTVRVFGMRKLRQLRDDDDEFDIDDRLCLMLALAAAKAHYRHADSKEYMGKAASILASVKWGNAGPKLYRAHDREDAAVEPRPVVV